MVQYSILILLAVCVTAAFCYDGMTVGSLSRDTAAELVFLLENFPILESNCTGHPVARNADFFLYNRKNPATPTALNGDNLDLIVPSKDVIVLIHGWLSSSNSSGIQKLKDAYLKRYDCNLISVDWSKQAFQPYSKAYCDVPGLGRALSVFLCTVARKLGISLSTIHVLGHSIGGQIAGFTGQYLALQCGSQQIGRITALDPAGPIFQSLHTSQRLDASDALFVDVIHTDEQSIGIWANSGDVDFHVSCGLLQPGCPNIPSISSGTLISDGICSSLRSIEYMTESIRSNNFIAVSCSMCPQNCRPDIVNEKYTVMGEECRRKPQGTNGRFYIPTKHSPPFAQGWDPYQHFLQNNSTEFH